MDGNRLQIVEELILTEENYVKDLQDVVQVRLRFSDWRQHLVPF